MNRRGFLSGVLGLAGAAVLPEPRREYSFLWGDRRFVRDDTTLFIATNSIYGSMGPPLTLDDIRKTVEKLRAMNVPPFDDGYYRLHLPPTFPRI